MEHKISLEEQIRILETLRARTDAEAERIKRYLGMSDLARTVGSPLYEIVERALAVPALAGFDNIVIPEVVPADINFNLFDFAEDHPARSKSDTYYLDDANILRTHDTVMWYYYMQLPEVQTKIARRESLGVTCYGKVYRKDEIDRRHMNIFHQFGGLYMVPNEGEKKIVLDDLRDALVQIVQSLFGEKV
jgi:phenylalanyl-tRNA synthetase alpha chain